MQSIRSQRARPRRTRSRAFTLVEVVIVLTIAGVLATVAGTRYVKFIEKARVARSVAELQAISRGLDALKIDGGELPKSLADADLGGTLDPWGHPYEYLKIAGSLPAGQAAVHLDGLPAVAAAPPGAAPAPRPRMDRFLVPINTDYDLYSVGADGQSEKQLDRKVSRDDVIRAANGSYFGLAENF
jgi:general secretion pathway protein G